MDSSNISPIPSVVISATTSQTQSNLQWFELIFYALTLPVLTRNYLSHRRTPSGRLGWLFLWNYSAMRTVGYILIKVGGSEGIIIAGNILTSASTTPLFFATAGIWHEVAHRFKYRRPLLFGWGVQILFHVLAAGCIGLVLAGVLTAFFAVSAPPAYSQPLVIIGAVGFLALWLGLCLMQIPLWNLPQKTVAETRLCKALIIGLPFLGLHVLYGLCGAAINDSEWSYLKGGPLAAQICMQVLPDCIIILIYTVAGFLSRDIVSERRRQHPHSYNGNVSLLPVEQNQDDAIHVREVMVHKT